MQQLIDSVLLPTGVRLQYQDSGDPDGAAIDGARLVVYPGAGHAVHWERPERFAADLANFVSRMFSPGGAPPE